MGCGWNEIEIENRQIGGARERAEHVGLCTDDGQSKEVRLVARLAPRGVHWTLD